MSKQLFLKLVVLFLLACVLMAGCEGPHAVRDGNIYDYINWVDHRANGSYMVWTVNVHDAVFCTYNQTLVNLANEYAAKHLWVNLEVESINTGDPDGQFLGQGCDSEAEGIQTFRLLGIQLTEEACRQSPSEEGCEALLDS